MSEAYVNVGTGVVVEDKPPESPVLKLMLSGVTPEISGNLLNYKEESKGTSVGLSGKVSTDQATSRSFIEATWRPMGEFNRSTPPDLRKNMVVEVWKLTTGEEYVWDVVGLDMDKRTYERGVWLFSAKAKAEDDSNDSNVIKVAVSTYPDEAYVTVQTPEVGYSTPLEITLNFKDGTFFVGDTEGNGIRYSATDKKVTLKGVEIELAGKTSVGTIIVKKLLDLVGMCPKCPKK